MINFDEEGLERFLAEDAVGPVVMLNLLRFQVDGGIDRYLAYVREFAAAGLNEKYGIELLYGGRGTHALIADEGQAWDMVALVRYPSRRHFVTMVSDPDYQKFEHLRTAALAESVLQSTVPQLVS